MKPLLVIKFFLAGMLLFICSLIASNLSFLQESEFDFVKLARLAQVPSKISMNEPQPTGEDKPIMEIRLHFYDDAVDTTRFNAFLKLVRKMKQSGAKVVLIPLPMEWAVVEPTQKAIQDMEATNVVVFGKTVQKMVWDYQAQTYKLRPAKNHYVRHPTFDRTKISWGVLSMLWREIGFLELVPLGYLEEYGNELIPDVSVEILRKYEGLDSSAIIRDVDEVRVGSHVIPISSDGIAYAKQNLWERSYRSYEVLAQYEKNGGLSFLHWERSRQTYLNVPDSTFTMYRNKIVVVSWYDPTDRDFYLTWSYAGYSSILQSILDKTLMTRSEAWNTMIVFLFVVLSAVTFLYVRSGIAIVIHVVVGGGSLLTSIWLFVSHSTLLSPMPGIVTLLLCAFVFPVVRVVHERNSLQDELKSLHAEKSGLENEAKEKRIGAV